MDRVVAARKLIGDLVKAEQIEVRRVEIVGRDLAQLLDTLKHPPTGEELGEWLEQHKQVTDVSASTAVLDELVDRYLRDPNATETATAARDPDLEREVRANPESSTPYLVYADWLQEREDPLGELIALGVANNTNRFERHLKRHQAYFLGESALEIATHVRLQWRFGFVQSIEALGELSVLTWQRLLGLRICELLESLTLRRPCSDTVDFTIAEAAPASMRELTLEAITNAPTYLLRRPLRSVSIRASPSLFIVGPDMFYASLDRLVLHVFNVSSSKPLELGVRELEILTTEPNLAFLRETKLPRTEHLILDVLGSTASAISALETISAPALTHLTVRNGELDPHTFRLLAELPLASRLRSLGLVNMGLTDETVVPLAKTPGFASLRQLDLSLNELTRTGLETMRTLAREVTSSRQHRRGHLAEKRVRAFAGDVAPAEEITEWRRAARDGDIRWGRYAEYELFVAGDLSRYGCTCSSFTQPCKHVVALALLDARTSLPAGASNGVETRVSTRAGLTDLLRASIDDD